MKEVDRLLEDATRLATVYDSQQQFVLRYSLLPGSRNANASDSLVGA